VLSFFLFVTSITAYFGTGYFIGRESAEAWDDRDNESWKSFLLFPYSYHMGNVGKRGRKIPVEWMRGDRDAYVYSSASFWPFKAAINLPVIVVLGIPKLISAGIQEVKALQEAKQQTPQLKGAEVAGLLPSPEDSLLCLTEKSAVIGHEIARLAAIKDQVDDEIRTQTQRAAAILEADLGEVD